MLAAFENHFSHMSRRPAGRGLVGFGGSPRAGWDHHTGSFPRGLLHQLWNARWDPP
jgi:hypothetical protein